MLLFIYLRMVPIFIAILACVGGIIHCNGSLSSKAEEAGTEFIVDSLSTLFSAVDEDSSSYWTPNELVPSIRKEAEGPLNDAEAIERAGKYVGWIDGNLDGVVDIYEVRSLLDEVTNRRTTDEWGLRDVDFVKWMTSFVGETPDSFPLFLVKLYKLMDENIDGKLNLKEVRMVIEMAQVFSTAKGEPRTKPGDAEKLFLSIREKFQETGMDLIDLHNLLHNDLAILSYKEFYTWISDYLGKNNELSSAEEYLTKLFQDSDSDSNGVITKGEVTAILHKHRPGYYTDERINRKWTRADRNEDGVITFNEYNFLENLKHPDRKLQSQG